MYAMYVMYVIYVMHGVCVIYVMYVKLCSVCSVPLAERPLTERPGRWLGRSPSGRRLGCRD